MDISNFLNQQPNPANQDAKHQSTKVAIEEYIDKLHKICLEMLYFANNSGDADSSAVRETWARLIDPLSKAGILEACSVLKRIGSHIYLRYGAGLPLHTLCLHLKKAALVVDDVAYTGTHSWVFSNNFFTRDLSKLVPDDEWLLQFALGIMDPWK